MPTPQRTRAGRIGLLVIALLLLAVAAAADYVRDDSLIRGVLSPRSPETPAESLVRGVRGGIPQGGR